MNTETEIVALATVLGMAIGHSENGTVDTYLSRLLIAAADALVANGVNSAAVDALAYGVRVGLEPGPEGGIGEKVVQLMPRAA